MSVKNYNFTSGTNQTVGDVVKCCNYPNFIEIQEGKNKLYICFYCKERFVLIDLTTGKVYPQ